jgi:isocitrate dehydrogenase kinase/phosphatase
MTREDVEGKYALVFNLDRIGRLLDAQPYRHLRFPRARFSPALLEELRDTCAQGTREDGEDVALHLCYVQRRLRPLNLYLREQVPEAARAALDYGQAIKDLARNNIFPGDMLLKNFGVSRHGRVVFTTTTSCAWSANASSATGRRPPATRSRWRPSRGSMSARTTFPWALRAVHGSAVGADRGGARRARATVRPAMVARPAGSAALAITRTRRRIRTATA